jgi:hypothetical protein
VCSPAGGGNDRSLSQLEASAAAAAALPLSTGLQMLVNHQQRRAARRTAPSGNSGSSGPPSGSKRSREDEQVLVAQKKVSTEGALVPTAACWETRPCVNAGLCLEGLWRNIMVKTCRVLSL